MLENLNYIYQAMYAIDLYDGLVEFVDYLHTWIGGLFVVLHVVVLVIMAIRADSYSMQDTWKAPLDWIWTAWRSKLLIASIVIFFLSITFEAVVPSKNTVKAYMGVKAVQATGDYLNSTDIPARSKATITKLWDKVDGYLDDIDIEQSMGDATDVVSGAVQSATDGAKAGLDSVKEEAKKTIGSDNMEKIIREAKDQAIDSIANALRK